MSNTKEQLAATSPTESEQSIDQIMNDIKDVITSTSANDDVLVLTEKVEEQPTAIDQDALAQQMEQELLAQQMAESLNAPAQEAQPVANDDILAQLDQQEPASTTQAAPEPQQAASAPAAQIEQLVREDVASSAKSMISELMNAQQPNTTASQAPSSNNPIEQLVMSLLKPELKSWLDKNLEPIVREIVQKEIQRIVPK